MSGSAHAMPGRSSIAAAPVPRGTSARSMPPGRAFSRRMSPQRALIIASAALPRSGLRMNARAASASTPGSSPPEAGRAKAVQNKVANSMAARVLRQATLCLPDPISPPLFVRRARAILYSARAARAGAPAFAAGPIIFLPTDCGFDARSAPDVSAAVHLCLAGTDRGAGGAGRAYPETPERPAR